MLYRIIFPVLVIIFPLIISSQIVTLEPPFPTMFDDITVTYDATQGNRGLLGVAQVYVHTGVILEGSTGWQNVVTTWGVDDPKGKMTNIGNDRHQISYNIKEYYGLSDQDKVLQLAFVFRNVNGSREGKTANNQDIFVPISDGSQELNSFFQLPERKTFTTQMGNSFPIKVITSREASIELFDNEQLIASIQGTELDYHYTVTVDGNHTIRYIAKAGMEEQTDFFSFAVNPPVLTKPLPEGVEAGLNEIDNHTAVFSLHAPGKDNVYIIGDFTDWKVDTTFFMNVNEEGTWWKTVTHLEPGIEYGYQYLVNGNLLIGDPYSTLVLDENHDRFIPEDVFPNLRPFPGDKTTGIVTVFELGKEPYVWQANNYIRPAKENLIIYELLVRDFLADRSYRSLIDTLDYLERLGINAIELMPVQEFEGNNSWGYNPSYHMALDKYYGDPETFKRLIDEAHKRGMAVIIDVVYNHAFGQSPLVRLYWDQQNNRPSEDNPWLNPVARHPFNVGFDFNHESHATQFWVKKVMKYWIEEYNIDGFRFDLSKGFTQNFTTDVGIWSQYDASRVAILKDYADFLWSIDNEFYVILEHFADNSEERELSNYGMMFWGNLNFAYTEAAMGYHDSNKSNFSWISHKNRGWNHPHVIGYMESHDEERMMFKNLSFGNAGSGYNIRSLDIALKRVELAANFFIPIPGPKMIWQFGELGYDVSINDCGDGTINNNCRLNDRPVRWFYQDEIRRKRVYQIFAALNTLKQNYEVFLTDDFNLQVGGALKSIKLNSPTENVVIIGNFDVMPGVLQVDFQHMGTWYEFYSGTELEVNQISQSFQLEAGEYRFYTDFPLDRPDIVSSVYQTPYGEVSLNLYPNPASDLTHIHINYPRATRVFFTIFDLQGRMMQSFQGELIEGTSVVPVRIDDLPSGQYIFNIRDVLGHQFSTRFIKIE
ncbi:MAG TPA: alpha-amylase family glycosyl hydrolase [Saprospiraceae bacterium]|nr:alpha-amylase family glycosyl hydrolase [Saprospiraceae bacterium]